MVPGATKGIARLMDWQALEAVATATAAGGAIAAAIFAYRAIDENRRANRTRLTVDLFDSHNTVRFTKATLDLTKAHGSLTLARAFVHSKTLSRTFTPQELETFTQDVAGVMGYAAALYAEGALDKKLFLTRASDFIAVAFYIYDPPLAQLLRAGTLRRNVVTLAQDCLQYRNKIPRNFDVAPELQTYQIPDDFGQD